MRQPVAGSMGPPFGMGPPMGMSPPPTAGSLYSVPPGMPVGPPMPPPGVGPMGPPMGPLTAPPSAASLGGPYMPMGGPPMTNSRNTDEAPMYQEPYTDPHMGGPMNGFGPQMHHDPPGVQFKHSPLHNRPEFTEVREDRKTVLQHPHTLPSGEKLPSGSDKYILYGALEDLNRLEMADQTEKLKRRRRINCVPALNALFLPWVLFLVVFSLASFYYHYEAPFTVALLNTTIVACCFGYAYSSFKNPNVRPDRAFYPTYLTVAFLIAVSCGWLLGDLNFWFNMQPAYNVEHLGTYTNVNPSSTKTRSGQVVPTRGKRYQDAGTVYFEHNTKLDLNRSMSFKMGDLYCVAPIVDPNCKGTCGFDFWAVGINCCSEDVSDFRCGEYKNPAAKSGLRMMHDMDRPNYRLAVLQAEGVHRIVSTHPIFFYWLADPVKELDHIKRKGFKQFVLLMIVSFFVNALTAFLALKWARDKFRDD